MPAVGRRRRHPSSIVIGADHAIARMSGNLAAAGGPVTYISGLVAADAMLVTFPGRGVSSPPGLITQPALQLNVPIHLT